MGQEHISTPQTVIFTLLFAAWSGDRKLFDRHLRLVSVLACVGQHDFRANGSVYGSSEGPSRNKLPAVHSHGATGSYKNELEGVSRSLLA